MSESSQATSPLVFTDSAAKKVWSLIQEEGDPGLHLRVYITGGGCSGFQYGFSFDRDIAEDDTVVTKTLDEGSVSLVVDAASIQYLWQAEIDYRQDMEGERFIIQNPNAKTTCGCGSSFSLDDDR